MAEPGWLGVKPVHDTCTSWFTRLLVWLTVTLLANGNGLPVTGLYMCGPVTVLLEPCRALTVFPALTAFRALTCATERDAAGSRTRPPASEISPATASTRLMPSPPAVPASAAA